MHLFPIEQDPASGDRIQADDRTCQLRASRAYQTRNAQNFTGSHFEVNVVKRFSGRKLLQAQQRRPDFRRLLWIDVSDLSPHHLGNEQLRCIIGCFAAADDLSVAQDRNII